MSVIQQIIAHLGSGYLLQDGKIIMNPALYIGEECGCKKFWWNKWYYYLRMASHHNQEGLCICGEWMTEWECHHSIVTKEDARGVPEPKKSKILQHSYNVLLLHPKCHFIYQSRRKDCLEKLFEIYLREEVEEWYNHVDMKVLRPLSSILA